MRYLLLVVFLCGPLQAAFDDFPRVQHRSLFAADDPYSGEPSTPRADPDEEPEADKNWDYADTGWFGLGFWGSPFLRFTDQPYGHAAGFGLEFSFHFSQQFALVAGLGLWSNYVDAREDDGRFVEVDAGGLEVELGFRWRFLRWDGGALYTDARAVFAVYDGPGPVRATSSIGGGGHFGVELGNQMFRVFFEAGLEFRAALNYRNVGWLNTGDSNGDAGLFFDLLRVGMRVYL
jgi:hypothetical protein